MLLSRAADSLYWISRYLERAEHAARVIDVRLDLGLDRKSNNDRWEFRRLFAALQMAMPGDPPRSPAALVDHAIFDLPMVLDLLSPSLLFRIWGRFPFARIESWAPMPIAEILAIEQRDGFGTGLRRHVQPHRVRGNVRNDPH